MSGPLFDIFNLGESETMQLKDLIAAIEKALGKKAKINKLPEQPGDVPLTCADISKARKLLGYNPTTPLRVGLPKFVEWFQSLRRLLTSHVMPVEDAACNRTRAREASYSQMSGIFFDTPAARFLRRSSFLKERCLASHSWWFIG